MVTASHVSLVPLINVLRGDRQKKKKNTNLSCGSCTSIAPSVPCDVPIFIISQVRWEK